MNVNPGELNKRISIVLTASGQDEDGYPKAPDEKDTVVHECWAKVTNTSGTEIVKANAEFSEAKTRFLIRYTTKSIDHSMAIIFGGNTYDINFINDYGFSHEYLEIYATLRK